MVTLRSLGYLVLMGVTVILYGIPIGVFGWMFSFDVNAKLGRQWGLINLWALDAICGLRYRIHGKQNMPSSNCIVLCKHQSAWETIALRALMPLNHTWVLKRELLRVPFFGWALWRYRPIAIDRKAGRRAMRQLIEEGRYWLHQGRWIVIFPEGTRVAPGERKRYGRGGGILAQKTGYPVLPIAHNAGVFWARRSVKKHAGCIDIVIGEPIKTAGLTSAEIMRQAENWIESTVENLPQDRGGPKPPTDR